MVPQLADTISADISSLPSGQRRSVRVRVLAAKILSGCLLPQCRLEPRTEPRPCKQPQLKPIRRAMNDFSVPMPTNQVRGQSRTVPRVTPMGTGRRQKCRRVGVLTFRCAGGTAQPTAERARWGRENYHLNGHEPIVLRRPSGPNNARHFSATTCLQ